LRRSTFVVFTFQEPHKDRCAITSIQTAAKAELDPREPFNSSWRDAIDTGILTALCTNHMWKRCNHTPTKKCQASAEGAAGIWGGYLGSINTVGCLSCLKGCVSILFLLKSMEFHYQNMTWVRSVLSRLRISSQAFANYLFGHLQRQCFEQRWDCFRHLQLLVQTTFLPHSHISAMEMIDLHVVADSCP